MGFFCCRSGYAFASLPHTPSPRAYFYEIRRARRAMGSLPLRAYARRFFCRRQRPSPTPSNKTALSPRTNPSASRKRRADKPPLPRWAFSVAAPAMRSLRSRIRAALLLPTTNPSYPSKPTANPTYVKNKSLFHFFPIPIRWF